MEDAMPRSIASLALPLLLLLACAPQDDGVLRISGSAVGAEGRILADQVARFMEENPDLRVEIQRTPDDATQRHQLYVQWLAARTGRPDVLQLDVIWTPELAAAGWILPLAEFAPDTAGLFPATLEANRWRGELYALPWFVDVGMLYWRTDLMDAPPRTLAEMNRLAEASGAEHGVVWQGARYEGLVTVFLEILAGFGGDILTEDGRVGLDSPEARGALDYLHEQLRRGTAPRDVLAWREEEVRFAFQNGRAAFMRNWPYAVPLLQEEGSRVRGRVGIAPVPGARPGMSAAALGGAQLAINAHSRRPGAAYRLIAYLTHPERMLERAAVTGQLPPRTALYDDPRLAEHLPADPVTIREIIQAAVPRPPSPVWTQLSETLQIHLHRALAGQVDTGDALAAATRELERVLAETGVREMMAEGASGR
jgi:multiple sugar transport system substrate-binding protein